MKKSKAAPKAHVRVLTNAEKPRGFRRLGRKLIPLSEHQKEIVARNAFKPGQPGGPGRPKGIVEAIRELTDDGVELVQKVWRIVDSPIAKISDQMAAIEWLADRGYGKAPQHIVVTPTSPIDGVDLNLPPEQLDALRNGLRLIDVPPSDPTEAPEDQGK